MKIQRFTRRVLFGKRQRRRRRRGVENERVGWSGRRVGLRQSEQPSFLGIEMDKLGVVWAETNLRGIVGVEKIIIVGGLKLKWV